MDVSAANPPNVYGFRHNGAMGGLLGRTVQLPWKGVKRGEREEGGEGRGGEGRGGGRGERMKRGEGGEKPSDLHTR